MAIRGAKARRASGRVLPGGVQPPGVPAVFSRPGEQLNLPLRGEHSLYIFRNLSGLFTVPLSAAVNQLLDVSLAPGAGNAPPLKQQAKLAVGHGVLPRIVHHLVPHKLSLIHI